jgi:hypothetical protein
MFERHKSGAWHVHIVFHRVTFTPLSVFREPWTAGFNHARVCDIRGPAYAVKYSTKQLLDNSNGKRPRIRASRGYGRQVMLQDKEVVQKLVEERNENVQDTWTYNLKQIIGHARNEASHTKKAGIWQFLQEVAADNGTIEIPETGTFKPETLDRQEVDVETGEVLPYGPPRRNGRKQPLHQKAIEESHAMGLLAKHQMLAGMANRLTTLVNTEAEKLQRREQNDSNENEKNKSSGSTQRTSNPSSTTTLRNKTPDGGQSVTSDGHRGGKGSGNKK